MPVECFYLKALAFKLPLRHSLYPPGRSMMGSIDIKVQNLVLEGRIRYFPLLGHPIIITSFMQTPKVRFDVNVSGVSMTAVPQMKRFMAGILQRCPCAELPGPEEAYIHGIHQ
jgi:hypothetical protein